MTNNQKFVVRYSDCFKQMVVADIEQNGLTIHQCQLKYGITGGVTIQNWIKKFGKNHLLNKIIRVETKNETSEIQLLKKELKALKEAYAEAMLERKVHQEIIKVSDEMFSILKMPAVAHRFPRRKK